MEMHSMQQEKLQRQVLVIYYKSAINVVVIVVSCYKYCTVCKVEIIRDETLGAFTLMMMIWNEYAPHC